MTLDRHLRLSAVLTATLLLAAPGRPSLAQDSGGSFDLASAEDGTWSRVITFGMPPARRDPAVAYDPDHDRMIAFGGLDFAGPNSQGNGPGPYGDTWVLDFQQPFPVWTLIRPPVSPPLRWGACLIHDPSRRRVVLFGGANYQTALNDVWVMNLDGPLEWRPLAVSGTPPYGRPGALAVYDPVRDRMIIHGGETTSGTWALSFSGAPTWTEIVPAASTPQLVNPHGLYDPVSDRILVTLDSQARVSPLHVWTLSLSAPDPGWTRTTLGTQPPDRFVAGFAFDPVHRRLLVHAGIGSRGFLLNDLWAMSVDEPMTWRRLLPAGQIPPVRCQQGAIWRPHGEFVIFGGMGERNIPGRPVIELNETWALKCDLPEGPPIVAGFSPPEGAAGDSVLVVAGRLGDPITVRFGGGAAQVLSSAEPRIYVRVPEDAVTGPITVETPQGIGASERPFRVWHRPLVTFASPRAGRIGTRVRIGGNHFLGATRVRIGASPGVPFEVVSDTEILATVDASARTGTITVENPRFAGTSAFVFRVVPPTPGGPTAVAGTEDERGMTSIEHDPRNLEALELAVESIRPNPVAGNRLSVTFVLPQAGSGRLMLLDVSGRRILERDLGDLAPGRHQIPLELEGRRAPGLYFVRLVQGAHARTLRAIFVD